MNSSIDINGNEIVLDCDVTIARFLAINYSPRFRARVVGFNKTGLPTHTVVHIRSHGSTNIETVDPMDCCVHNFNNEMWNKAEQLAKEEQIKLGRTDEQYSCGGIFFEQFQRTSILEYQKIYYGQQTPL